MNIPHHSDAQRRRRSQIYRWHDAHRATYETGDSGCLVSGYGDAAGESECARKLALCDLSLVHRAGVKGAGAPDFLGRHARLPDAPNQALDQDGGGVIARLSFEEFVVLDPPALDAGYAAALADACAREAPARTYLLPRADSHCQFAVTGADAPQLLATVCAIDLRPGRFAPGAVAQTSVARLNAIVLRAFCDAVPVYYLLCDVSAAQYLWECLHAAVTDAGGGAIGVAALRGLLS